MPAAAVAGEFGGGVMSLVRLTDCKAQEVSMKGGGSVPAHHQNHKSEHSFMHFLIIQFPGKLLHIVTDH